MHRQVEDNLEEILESSAHPAESHLAECAECREEIAAMRAHATAFRSLRAPGDDLEPRPGFYARVMERIEAEGPKSIWNMFFESTFGRRIAVASLALLMLMGVYLVSTDQPSDQMMVADTTEAISGAMEVLPVPVISGQFVALHDEAGVMSLGEPNDDAVLANLVTYREQ
jgi:anti-sigma factor RsiW